MKKLFIPMALLFLVSAGTVLTAQETAKKDTTAAPMKEIAPVAAPADEKEAMDCPHCTKDKKCPMHAKAEMKEADCKMCTKDKKCAMHAKGEMKEADCKMCSADKKCEMHEKKATPAKKSVSPKKPSPKK